MNVRNARELEERLELVLEREAQQGRISPEDYARMQQIIIDRSGEINAELRDQVQNLEQLQVLIPEADEAHAAVVEGGAADPDIRATMEDKALEVIDGWQRDGEHRISVQESYLDLARELLDAREEAGGDPEKIQQWRDTIDEAEAAYEQNRELLEADIEERYEALDAVLEDAEDGDASEQVPDTDYVSPEAQTDDVA